MIKRGILIIFYFYVSVDHFMLNSYPDVWNIQESQLKNNNNNKNLVFLLQNQVELGINNSDVMERTQPQTWLPGPTLLITFTDFPRGGALSSTE